MKNALRTLAFALALLLTNLNGWGQVSYLGLNGGFEGAATIDNTNTFAGPQAGKWTKANASQTLTNETSTIRSGANSLKVNNSSTTGRRVWSPNITVSSTTSSVTVQFYVLVANTTNGQEAQPGVINNAEGISGAYATGSAANTWTKVTYNKGSATYTTVAGLFLHRQKGTGGDMFIDDMCVYTGAVDGTPANSPGTVTVNNASASSLDVSWAAATGGVDGGGYMVVRYATNPNADNDPLTNGIYATGNTYTLGTGSLTGTVRYVGTGTSFTDNAGLSAGTTYYYKVYTVDKAYNYSAESSGSGATSSSGFTITVTQGSNGTIAPTTTSVASGGNQTFTITPDACYNVSDVLVDGSSVGAVTSYPFTNVTAAHTITASYAIKTHTLTASAGANGSITSSATVNCGTNKTFTITPASCYTVADVLVDGVSVGAVTSYPFTNVTANHTISATFAISATYSIGASAGANGSISPSGSASVACGGNSATYTFSANSCYNLSDVLVDGVSQGAIGSYQFTNVTANHTISASFAIITYNINASAGANGSISSSGVTAVNCGSSKTYTITPNSCYNVADVLVDGVSVGAVTSYTFNTVGAAHTIAASFVIKGPYNITASAGANGSISPTGITAVTCGATQAYTITPSGGYSVQDVLVDGVSVGAVTTYSFTNVTTTHTISATFYLAPTVLYQHNFGTSSISAHPYTVSPTATPVAGVLNANLSNSSWSNNGSAWTSFAGNAGQAIASSSISGSNPWTLTFTVAPGYSMDVTSFNFWRQSSQSSNTWSMTINGTNVGSGTIPTSGTAIGTTSVANAVTGLTGTVSVVITYGGTLTGSIRVDDFTLSGFVTPSACNAPTTNATALSNATPLTTTSIGLSWAAAPLADGYVVAIRTTDNNFSGLTMTDGTSLPTAGAAPWTDNEITSLVTGTTATISGLSASTPYYFKVYSYRNCTGTYTFNNSNASGNPLSTTTATPAAEISVVRTSNSANVADGGSFSFGSVNVGSPLDIQFTIANDAAATDNLTIPATLTAGGAFSVSAQPGSTSLAPGASTTFTIRYTPVSGASSQAFSFANNDANENPYNFTLTGTGVPACVAPNAVTNITLTPAAGTINGVIDAPTGGADGYLVVRNTTGTLSGTPSGTYNLGDAFGTGTVVAFGSSTSFSATSLGANATYYMFVYPYNNTGCFGGPAYSSSYNESATTLNLNYQSFDNFNRTSSTVGTPSSGGAVTWVEDEGGTSCSPATGIIRTANNMLEVSNCNLGNTGSCGTNSTKQISFDMSGKYATQFNTSSQVMEWYVNLSHNRSTLAGFGGTGYGLAYILGSSDLDFASGAAQGYALIAGEAGVDPLRLVSFNGQISNWSNVVNSAVDFTQNKMLSVKVTYDPSNDTWSLLVRDDGASFADPTTITGTPGTATNSAYTSLNLKYAGAFWKHNSSCEDMLKIDNMFIPSPTQSPEIKVEYTTNNAVNVADGGSYSFGPVKDTGGTYTATYTITNQGTANLTLGTITIGGTHASNFTYTSPVSTTLAPNATTTFTITFDPSATGTRNATFSMVTNDGDENPFNFALTGEGTNTLPVINEFVTDINGSDTYEYVEIYGETGKSYSNLWVLGVEGDNVNTGRIENIYQVGTTNAGGYWINTVAGTDQIENNTITYILVEGFNGALNDYIDADGDGTIDNKPWNRILDDVAYRDVAGAKVYSSVFFTSTFAGYSPPQNVGGASRIPNGFDSDATSDWMRNEFSGFGIPGFNTATPVSTEAINTPAAANVRYNVWTGTVSTDWSVPGNWSNNVVPSSTVDAVIPNVTNDPVFPTGTYHAVARYLVLENNSSLNMTTGDLTVHANALTANTVTITNGVLIMGGSTASSLTANNITLKTLAIANAAGVTVTGTVAITDALELRSGQLTNTGSLTLKSTATTHAIFNDFGAPVGTYTGSFSGSINEERYYRATSANSYNQHYMGSPVSNATLAQFGAGGSSGAVTPTSDCDETRLDLTSVYGSVFSYNEATGASCPMKSWTVKANSETADPAKGFSVAKTGAGTLTVTGTPNTAASYDITGLNNSTWTKGTLQHPSSTAFGSGWHLVSNPYNATLDLTSITPPTGFDNQIQVWDVIQGQYYTLTGPSKLIAPFQAFFVHKTSAGTGTYTINGNWRVATPATFFALNNPEELTITATNTATNLYDVTMVGFNADATNQFDAQYDANKLTGSIGRHNLSTQNNGYELNTNILSSIQSTSTVNMTFEPGQAGDYKLTFGGLNSFDPTSYIMLEDKKLNTMYDVRSGDYSFTADATDNWDRFVLHFSPKAEVTIIDQNCETLGTISVVQPGTANWSYEITTSNNTVVSSGTLNSTTPIVVNATIGTYTLTLTDNNNYQVVKTITVDGSEPVTAAMTASATTAEVNTDITFTSTGQGASYAWSFGDGATDTNATAIHSYAVEGAYVVTLTITSYRGCTSTTTQTINVTKTETGIGHVANGKAAINIWSNGSKVFVDFGQLSKTDATIDIYNVLGQQLVNDNFNRNAIYSKSIENMEAGYVIVKVRNNNEVTTKRVILHP